MKPVKPIGLFIGLICLFAAGAIVSLLLGSSDFSVQEMIAACLEPQGDDMVHVIIWQVRLPRVLLGMIVGAGLASCGAAFQGMLRNPLADPFTLGISGGAAFGATIGILLKVSGMSLSMTAFGGAMLSALLTYMMASRKQFSVTGLILAGVVLNFFFSALVLLLFSVSSSEQVHTAVMWLMGDMSTASFSVTGITAGLVFVGVLLLVFLGRDIDALTLGEEKATHLGLHVEAIQKLVFAGASLVTGACVASAGMIGFVGLIVPHLIRRFSGPSHRFLIVCSGIGGAALLCICDAGARTLAAPTELPVGVITGIFGSLFFLVFFVRTREWEFF